MRLTSRRTDPFTFPGFVEVDSASVLMAMRDGRQIGIGVSIHQIRSAVDGYTSFAVLSSQPLLQIEGSICETLQ